MALWLVGICVLMTLIGTAAGGYFAYRQTLLPEIIGILFIACCALYLCNHYIVRHLQFLARQIDSFDFTDSDAVLTLCRPSGKIGDELDALVSGINRTLIRARQACKTLAGNEQRLLLFFDSTEEAIIGLDLHGSCTFANDACLQLLAHKDYESVIGKKASSLFIHSDGDILHRQDPQYLINKAMAKGIALQSDDGFISLPCGRKVFVAMRAYPVFKEGLVSGALVFINDNSEKRQLRQERELLSQAIEQVPVMILIADSDQRIQYANRGAEKSTGFAQEELLGQSIFLIDERSAVENTGLVAAKASLRQGQPWEGILEVRSKWGKPLKFFSMISPVFDNQKQVANLISVAREVSFEIARQNEVINTKKMEAVGRLSASFAHEFGNPLFGVRSVLLDICERNTFTRSDKYLLELAHDECERMRSMVREFEILDRQSPIREKPLQVYRIIMRVLQDFESLFATHNISTLCDFPENTQEIVGNTGKLSVVLHNIIGNATESMAKNGGVLTVSTFLDGNFLKVAIGDNGCGVKKEYEEFIFEPFFSTKPEVEGKGLGLSVAYGTMKSLGGSLTFVSEEGKGTVFTMHIPIHQETIMYSAAA